MLMYTAQIAFQAEDQHDTERATTIHFKAPSHLEAALGCGRWFANRHGSIPEWFTRLLCVKIWVFEPQEFLSDGYLPADNRGQVFEYKYDTAGLPYKDYAEMRLGQKGS